MNKISDTVVFNQDLRIDFDANLIDNLEVYNFSTKTKTKCEHWGWNDEGENNLPFYDFGIIADFDFEISKTKTKFYFGDSPLIGFYGNEINKLFILGRGEMPKDNFNIVSSFYFEKEYPAPKTMLDLANYIDNFLALRLQEVLLKKQEHKQKIAYKPSAKVVVSDELDDLPF